MSYFSFSSSRAAACAALSLLSSLAAASAWAGVSVSYVKPEEFRDMPFSDSERQRTLGYFTGHFNELGKTLPAGEELKIEVLDIDLAGRTVPSRMGVNDDIRVMKGMADWPTMHLRYTLEADGKVIASGDAHLADMDYLSHINRYSSGEPIRYEKAMLDDWFKKTFTAPKKAG
jgi:hypothetical protein